MRPCLLDLQLRLTKNLCTKPEPKPQPQLPQDGANVTLTIAGTWCGSLALELLLARSNVKSRCTAGRCRRPASAPSAQPARVMPAALPTPRRHTPRTTAAAGATQTQVADQASRVVAAVAKLLGRHASEAPFVAAVAGGPGAEEALGEGAFRVASAGAGGGLYRIQSAPGANPFTSASPFNGLADGWLQFEGPSYTSLSTQSADAQEDAGGEHADKGSVKDKGKGALSKKDTNNDPGSAVVVTLAAPSGDPEALYSRATDAEALATLVGELGAMGLVLDREPSVVAFKVRAGWGLTCGWRRCRRPAVWLCALRQRRSTAGRMPRCSPPWQGSRADACCGACPAAGRQGSAAGRCNGTCPRAPAPARGNARRPCRGCQPGCRPGPCWHRGNRGCRQR